MRNLPSVTRNMLEQHLAINARHRPWYYRTNDCAKQRNRLVGLQDCSDRGTDRRDTCSASRPLCCVELVGRIASRPDRGNSSSSKLYFIELIHVKTKTFLSGICPCMNRLGTSSPPTSSHFINICLQIFANNSPRVHSLMSFALFFFNLAQLCQRLFLSTCNILLYIGIAIISIGAI